MIEANVIFKPRDVTIPTSRHLPQARVTTPLRSSSDGSVDEEENETEAVDLYIEKVESPNVDSSGCCFAMTQNPFAADYSQTHVFHVVEHSHFKGVMDKFCIERGGGNIEVTNTIAASPAVPAVGEKIKTQQKKKGTPLLKKGTPSAKKGTPSLKKGTPSSKKGTPSLQKTSVKMFHFQGCFVRVKRLRMLIDAHCKGLGGAGGRRGCAGFVALVSVDSQSRLIPCFILGPISVIIGFCETKLPLILCSLSLIHFTFGTCLLLIIDLQAKKIGEAYRLLENEEKERYSFMAKETLDKFKEEHPDLPKNAWRMEMPPSE